MTLFDIVALGVLILSGFAGWVRGGVREMVSVVSLTLALVIAAYSLPWSGPVFRLIIHPAWAGSAATVVAVFVAAFILIRLGGNLLSQSLERSTALDSANRMIGLGFGLFRAMVFLGLFALLFNAVTPSDLRPSWITGAKLYPAARMASVVIQALAPKGIALTHGLSDDITGRVKRGVFEDGAGASPSSADVPDPSQDKASTVSPQMSLDNGAAAAGPPRRARHHKTPQVLETSP